LGINAGTRVEGTRPWHQRLEAASHWQMEKRITKHRRRSCWSMEKAVRCMRESERTSLWTSAKLEHFSDLQCTPTAVVYLVLSFLNSDYGFSY